MYVALYRMFYELCTLLPEMISYVFVIKSVPVNMDYIYVAMYVFLYPLNTLLGTAFHTSWLLLYTTGL